MHLFQKKSIYNANNAKIIVKEEKNEKNNHGGIQFVEVKNEPIKYQTLPTKEEINFSAPLIDVNPLENYSIPSVFPQKTKCVPFSQISREEAEKLITYLMMPSILIRSVKKRIIEFKKLPRKMRSKEEIEIMDKFEFLDVEEVNEIVGQRIKVHLAAFSLNRKGQVDKYLEEYASKSFVATELGIYKDSSAIFMVSSAVDHTMEEVFIKQENIIRDTKIKLLKHHFNIKLDFSFFKKFIDDVKALNEDFLIDVMTFSNLEDIIPEHRRIDFSRHIDSLKQDGKYLCSIDLGFYSERRIRRCIFNDCNVMGMFPIFILGVGYFSEKYLENVILKYSDFTFDNIKKFRNSSEKGRFWGAVNENFNQIYHLKGHIESRTRSKATKNEKFNEDALPMCINTPHQIILKGEIGQQGKEKFMRNSMRFIWGSTMKYLGQSEVMSALVKGKMNKNNEARSKELLEILKPSRKQSKPACGCGYVQAEGLCPFFEANSKKPNGTDPISACLSEMTGRLGITDIEDITAFRLHSPHRIISEFSSKIYEKENQVKKKTITEQKKIPVKIEKKENASEYVTEEDWAAIIAEDEREKQKTPKPIIEKRVIEEKKAIYEDELTPEEWEMILSSENQQKSGKEEEEEEERPSKIAKVSKEETTEKDKDFMQMIVDFERDEKIALKIQEELNNK